MTHRKRLAMVACHGPAEGPWALARGFERAVRVSGGECVVVEVLSDTAETVRQSLTPGTHPFPENAKQFRFIKELSGGPTTVEILFE